MKELFAKMQTSVFMEYQWSVDRLALLAVSVFHLSHWRTDATVASYVLA